MDVNPGTDANFDEEESTDAAPLDITPRQVDATAGGGARRGFAIGAVAVLLVVMGFVVFNGLTDAATFYYNVDEAVAMRDELADKRFRMQGNVIDGTITETGNGVEFVLAFGDEQIDVVHRGAPPELFKPEIPVIIEGSFAEGHFASDEILIKHDSTYAEEHDARLREARDDAERRTEEE